MSDQSSDPIVPPAVENYRTLAKPRRGSQLAIVRLRPSDRRILVGLTSSALLVATALLLFLAASVNAEERPFIWPPNNEVVEMEGPWAPLDDNGAEEVTEMKESEDAISDNEEINR